MHAMNDPDVYVSLEELKLVLCALPQNNKRPKNSFSTANKSCIALPNFLQTISFSVRQCTHLEITTNYLLS